MNYTWLPLSSALTDLSQRLYDVTGQMWPPAELTAYIQDALRTWNAHTSFYRSDMIFTLQPKQTWYDLPSQKNSVRPYTVEDQSQIYLIEYGLLEPLTASYPMVWGGSLQFSIGDILSAWTDKQNEVLGTTGCTLTPTQVPAPITWQRIYLPDTTLVLRRVAWIPDPKLGFSAKTMRQSDAFSKQSYDPLFSISAPAPPQNWMQSTQTSPSFDVDRMPPVSGQYDCMLSVSAAPSVSTQPNLCSVPDDWAWVVRWGALAHLLSHESNAADALRAEYAEKRFQQGVALMADTPTVLSLRINNIPKVIDGLRNADDFNPGWQGQAAGPPRVGYAAGMNLMAFPPVDQPQSSSYSATLTVVANMPVPSSLGDPLQIPRDDYDSVMDEAQHIAMFKIGGEEFLKSLSLHAGFLKRAALYNSKLLEMGIYERTILETSHIEDERNPQYTPGQGPKEVLGG